MDVGKIRKISLGLNRDKIKAVLVGGPEIQNSIRSDWYGDELFSYGEGEMFTREICKLLIEGANIQDIHQMQRIANAEKKDDIYIIEKDGELYNSIPIYTFDNLKKLKIEDFCTDYCFMKQREVVRINADTVDTNSAKFQLHLIKVY